VTQQSHTAGGAARDGGELSWACANQKHEGCRGVNCTCPHHTKWRQWAAIALKLAKRLTRRGGVQNG